MIKVSHVWHHYGVRPILRDVSFQVDTGDVVAIVGPNGMGKSTLLGVLAGVLAQIEGTVAINGLERRSTVENERAIRRCVFYLPDQPWLPELRTPREYLVAIGEVYDIPFRRRFEHTDRLLSLFELDQQADQNISALSNGQKHKVALAGALASEASVLLLDEPFGGGLDPAGILALRQVLSRRANPGERTVILTTPVPSIVAEVATHVLILRAGQLDAYLTLDELRAQAGEASVEKALERLVFPEAVANLDKYFGHEASS